MKTLLRTCIILGTWLLAAQAQAIQIKAVGQGRAEGCSQKIGICGLLGATWAANTFSKDRIVPGIVTARTSQLFGSLSTAEITAYGLDTSRNIPARRLGAGGVFARLGTGDRSHQTLPGGFKGINDCLFNEGCRRGFVKRARHAGETDHETPPGTGDFSDNSPDGQPVPVNVETNPDPYHPEGCGDCQPTAVPEPPMVALLGLGLVLIGLQQYRRRRPLAVRRQS